MSPTQKKVFWLLILISIIYFIIFMSPNNTGAKDNMMISLFEPDEFAQYPVVLKMIKSEDTVKQSLINFTIYGHYYYGWPFYASSALTLLIVNFFYETGNTQVNMLLLRQVIGILPMLCALLILTYIQTKFKSYIKAIGLFIFLVSVSAVVENSMWWHVDSLAFFFIALTFFFLDKDELRFGQNFLFAAIATGLATGTKVIGLFFFLAIPVYLLIGVTNQYLSWKKAIQRGMVFVVIMAVTILFSNPFILIRSQLNDMVEILSRQSLYQNKGWVLNYNTGPASWYPIIERLYGNLSFIILALVALGVGIWKKESRTRSIIITLWAIPFGLYILFVVAIKPTHFFLPILLPIYSTLVFLFEIPLFEKKTSKLSWTWGGMVLLIIVTQFTTYLNRNFEMYREVLSRETHEESLIFYRKLENEYLIKITTDEKLVVFRDVRMYIPDDSRWVVRSYWNSKYSTIEKIQPDIIILWSQRILDYTQEGALNNAVDPSSFQDTYQFYIDAKNNQLRGYQLVYRDAEGLFFVSNDLFENFFK